MRLPQSQILGTSKTLPTVVLAMTQTKSDQVLYKASRANFHALSRDEQITAIRGMAAHGSGENTIAVATELSVEIIRQALAEGAA